MGTVATNIQDMHHNPYMKPWYVRVKGTGQGKVH